jgi:arsenical pump membrane protein
MNPSFSFAQLATWGIAFGAVMCVILRPWNLPQALWAAGGAIILVIFGLLPITAALAGIAAGTDVYLFLLGMMVLSEVARQEGLFDFLAGVAARFAKGSAPRLFVLIYVVGILVTALLSNDATAVVLTPAVAATVKSAKIEEPLPYLLICALIANAASFVLPIANPANLVIYGNHMPPLLQWLPSYSLASILSIAVTFLALRWTQRNSLKQKMAAEVYVPALTPAGKTAAVGIVLTSIALLTASAFDMQLGLPTAIAGGLTLFAVLLREQKAPWRLMREISWGILPLVAGLFVLVQALDHTGVIDALKDFLRNETAHAAAATAWGSGIAIAFVSNLINNLPAGLIAGTAVRGAHVSDHVTRAILIGVDLGPNLSITGSLATLLWLDALKREGLHVSGRTFLKYGILVMPPALIAALAGVLFFN